MPVPTTVGNGLAALDIPLFCSVIPQGSTEGNFFFSPSESTFRKDLNFPVQKRKIANKIANRSSRRNQLDEEFLRSAPGIPAQGMERRDRQGAVTGETPGKVREPKRIPMQGGWR